MSEAPGRGGAEDAIAVQFALDSRRGVPAAATLRRWAAAAVEPAGAHCELCLRVVDEPAMRELNRDYRGRESSTNVLSFPGPGPLGGGAGHLGDVVLCIGVARREAAEQGKAVRDHFAHLVIHGVLHLQGYDHIKRAEAVVMETREREILERLGIGDPYRVPEHERDAAASSAGTGA